MAPQSNKKGIALNTVGIQYMRERPPHAAPRILTNRNMYMGLGTQTIGKNTSLLRFPNGYFSRR